MEHDPIKALQQLMLPCKALPDQFTASDVAELKSMGISVSNTEPQLHEYVKEKGERFQ